MPEDHLVTPINSSSLQPESVLTKKGFPVVVIFAMVVLLGGLAGYFLSTGKSGNSGPTEIIKNEVKGTNEFGSADTKTFRDSATGVLEVGGLNGEGTHKLIRDGGPSKTVYLVSSVLDLSEFEGLKVEVWGETNKGKSVGWLMDVGRIKKLE